MTSPTEHSGHFASENRAGEDWWWRLEDEAGNETGSGEPARFPSQSDAESWVGETWEDLVEQGVDAVTLFEADRRVYGPMSLHPQG